MSSDGVRRNASAGTDVSMKPVRTNGSITVHLTCGPHPPAAVKVEPWQPTSGVIMTHRVLAGLGDHSNAEGEACRRVLEVAAEGANMQP